MPNAVKIPIVFLPGMMCDAVLYAPQLSQFSKTHGVMIGNLTGAETISEIAHNVLQNAPERFALCGLSMGGIVALEMMRIASDRIERLALLDTTYKADAAENAPIRDAQIEKVKAGALEEIMRDELKPQYLAEGPRKQMTLDLCMDMAKRMGANVFIQQSLALKSRDDHTKTLSQIKMPTLIMCGEADTLCPVERHQEMHDMIPGSALAIVKNAGHLPPLENPAATNQHLAKWLNQ